MLNKQLQNVLADVFELRLDQIHDALTREDVDNWDSLKQMDLVISLEKAFDISLSFDEIISINNVQDILTVLSNKGVA